MKVMLVNGSPHKAGSTNRALEEVARTLEAEGIEAEIFQLGAKPVQDCIACMQCRHGGGKCVFDDVANELIEKAKALEDKKLPADIDYEKIDGLRLEARQKLNKIRPENLGQAGRISGVNPADIAVLMVYLSLKHA